MKVMADGNDIANAILIKDTKTKIATDNAASFSVIFFVI